MYERTINVSMAVEATRRSFYVSLYTQGSIINPLSLALDKSDTQTTADKGGIKMKPTKQMIQYMKSEVAIEKACDIEYEVGVGLVEVPTAEHFWAMMSIVSEGYTEVDVNASEISKGLTGYIWVC